MHFICAVCPIHMPHTYALRITYAIYTMPYIRMPYIRMPYIYLSEFCAVVQPMDFIRINKSTGRFFLYI